MSLALPLTSHWLLDLGAVYKVDQIRIFNRTDCCSERIAGAEVFWSDGAKNTKMLKINSIKPTKGVYAMNTNGNPVRYLRIQLPKPGVISLAEVEVYGDPKPIKAAAAK